MIGGATSGTLYSFLSVRRSSEAIAELLSFRLSRFTIYCGIDSPLSDFSLVSTGGTFSLSSTIYSYSLRNGYYGVSAISNV